MLIVKERKESRLEEQYHSGKLREELRVYATPNGVEGLRFDIYYKHGAPTEQGFLTE